MNTPTFTSILSRILHIFSLEKLALSTIAGCFFAVSPSTSAELPERFFAPYVDATLYPKFDLAGVAQSQGTKYYTLAFIVTDSALVDKDPLTLAPSELSAWGAQSTFNLASGYMKSDIDALRAVGGDVMVSFGGQANIALAGMYSNPFDSATQATEYQQREDQNVDHLKRAYQAVIDAYDFTHIDFDIEGQWVSHPYSIQLRSKAIKELQDDASAAGKTLVVWFTLPSLPNGLDGNGVTALNNALSTGVDLHGVNIMAMDYGSVAPIIDPATGVTCTIPNIPPRENDDPNTGVDSNNHGMMGDYGIIAAKGLFNQLQSAYSSQGISLTDAQIWRKIGITPMIGVNDVQEEVTDLSEAGEIYQFALAKNIGMLSFWSITRDHPAPAGSEGKVEATHSGLNEPSYTFSHLMIPFSGDGSEAIYLSNASVEEGDTGTTTATVKLWRLPATNESRVVNWSTSDGAATSPTDFTSATGSVTFAPGETEKSVSITIVNDTDVESDEAFEVTFTTASGVPIADPTATVTILDDDTPPTVSITDQTVGEAVGTATFTVSLSRPMKPGLTASVDFAVDSGTAIAGSDFTATTGTLSFSGAETSRSITVNITDDTTEETDEVFVVSLSNPSQVTLSDNQGLGKITDNDGTPEGGYVFYVNGAPWSTGWSGVMQVTNPGPDTWEPWQLSFDAKWNANFFESTYNTALSSDDGAGNWHHVIDPPSWGGGTVAPGATFQISWTAIGTDTTPPTNVQVNGVNMPQMDLGPGVSVADVSSLEGDSGSHTANFTITLSEVGTAPVHVSYAIVGGTATSGTDFTVTPATGTGTVVFAAGELTKTIPVTILGDTLEEGDESVQIFLAGADGQPLPRITSGEGTLTITGDDWTPSVFITSAIVKEGNSGTRTATLKLRLNRIPKSTESISVNYETLNATATAGSDFTAKSGTVHFGSGQTEKSLNFTIHGDTDDERLEYLKVNLFAPVDCLLGDDTASIQIIDDDSPGTLAGQRVVAYVFGSALLPPADKVTHINYAFSNLNADGSWNFSGNLSSLRNLRTQNPNLKILVSIGGWGWSENFSSVADDPVKRQRFADSAASLINSEDLDGVDIDWEWPGAQGDGDTPAGPRDRENFTKLIQATRTAIDALGVTNGRIYELTAFTGAGSAQMAGLEMAAIGQLFDFINVQGYDLHGTWEPITGHASGLYHNPADPGGANLNIASVLNIYEAAGIPRNKLLVGAAFYARTYNGASPTNHGLFQSHGGWGTTPLYKDLLTSQLTTASYYWDDSAQVPYLFNNLTHEFVTFDDPRSCAEKADFSRKNGYGGTYFWQMSGDTSDFHLLTALYDSALAPPSTDTDLDGIYDQWERDYFGNLTTAGPGTDFDLDGQSDAAEFHAGTNPKDSTDVLHIITMTSGDTEATLTWSIVAGKTYNVEYSPDLNTSSWLTIATGLTTGTFTDTDSSRLNGVNGFYRVRVP